MRCDRAGNLEATEQLRVEGKILRCLRQGKRLSILCNIATNDHKTILVLIDVGFYATVCHNVHNCSL